ncbi:MAG TPA: hypothetical protein VFA89_11460 [Terriglobales bacterium]|nr:hypothetical protein [Terriglobales bacterium]
MTMTTTSGFGATPVRTSETSAMLAEASEVAYRSGIRILGPYILKILQLEERVEELERRLEKLTAKADQPGR